MISAPRSSALKLLFKVLPPLTLPGQTPIDWSKFPIDLASDEPPDETIVPLLLPLVPAGFTGVLEFTLTPPNDAIDDTMTVYPGIGTPLFSPDSTSDGDDKPDLDQQTVDDLVAGAQSYIRRVLTTDKTLDGAFIENHLRTQLETILGSGVDAWLETGGGSTTDGTGSTTDGQPAYSLPGIMIDAGITGYTRDGTPLPEIPAAAGSTCVETGWSSCAPPPCTSDFGKKRPPGRACSCPWEFFVRRSVDPNDKVGSQQGGGRLVSGDEPLRYVIHFENDPLQATAPAQEVVITDQLDVSKLDLESFSLGPISFGSRKVVPIPGLSELTTDVDLRPDTELLVRVSARLDEDTGLLTWRFMSLDPVTRQPTTDPLAGFLPPNLNPPEGDGAVLFTINRKTGLATDTEICNQAQIVFDVNEPILTPLWCNILDATKPLSQVSQPAAPTQTSASFTVQWSGADTGSGIQDYTIFVSENGGLFAPFVSYTQDTSATFTGQPGSTYAFYSVARDKALNVEEPPALPDVTTTILENGSPTANAGDDQVVEATSASGATATLSGAASSDPDGDQLTYVWSGSFGTTAGLVVNPLLALGTHSITLTVDDGKGGVSTDTVTIVVRDTVGPTVAAPAGLVVPATESAGARGAASSALSAFLAGGSATDIVDAAPVRLSPQVNGADVDSGTLFPIGTTTVTFRFRDFSENIGVSQSTVTVSVGSPRIAASVVAKGIQSPGIRYVDVRFANTGTGHARNLSINQVVLKTLAGTGTVAYDQSLSPALPHVIGSLDAGASTTIRFFLNVPATVTRFSMTENGTFNTVSGVSFSFSLAQAVIP